MRRRVYSHEIKNKIKVDIKVSILTLEVTPLASLRSLPSIESVRQHSEIISRNWGGGGGWGAGVYEYIYGNSSGATTDTPLTTAKKKIEIVWRTCSTPGFCH